MTGRDAMYAFDEDRRVAPVDDTTWRGEISSRWDIGSTPNGGYVLAVASSALERAMPGLDPLTSTVHFLRPTTHGPCDIRVEVVKKGRTLSTGIARIRQAGKETAIVLATYGTLADRAAASPRHIAGAPPVVPPVEEAPPDLGMFADTAITSRFDGRIPVECLAWAHGEKGPRAEIRGRIRFSDGRPPDPASLAVFADGMPPAVLNVATAFWIPTLELTVHARARPAPGWLFFVLRTRFLFDGHFEEDGEFWDERGVLVGQSRQLASFPG